MWEFKRNSITSVTGVSGGGKSSLAYNSLYEKCRQEFSSIEAGHYDNIGYQIKSSENIIPAVALKQKNSNVNPRSTIYSYLNFSSLISSHILEDEVCINSNQLKINKPDNQCKHCEGLGETFIASINKLIDENTKIIDNPFVLWKSPVSNKKHKLLLEHCSAENIPLEKYFDELTDAQRKKLTDGESSRQYEISFKYSGKNRKRKLNFIGALEEINTSLTSGTESAQKLVLKYCQSAICTHCLGSRINTELYATMHICGVPFNKFLSAPHRARTRRIEKKLILPQASISNT